MSVRSLLRAAAWLDSARQAACGPLAGSAADTHMQRLPLPAGVDPWGFRSQTATRGLAVGLWLYEHYFRVRATGLERVPARGPVMIVANHSGQLPIDGLLLSVALATRSEAPRLARPLVDRFIPSVPWVGQWLSACGCVVGDPANAERLLDAGEAVIVFPEGTRGSGKLFDQRYRLQRFGQGFMRIAMKRSVPVVPVGVVGCEESMPSFANISPVARALGLPYFPLSPSYLPLPARVHLGFGEPRLEPAGAQDDEALLRRAVRQVRRDIALLMHEGLRARSHVFR